jgi:D-sedoheptulose 7-phosphate isomerase
MIFIMGNGGSASTATHFANDLGKGASRSGKLPFRVISLTDNVAWLTALANDEGYEHVFVRQLENHVRKGDLVIGISASGNSRNVLRALQFAKSRGALTIGLVGFDGGKMHKMVDESLLVRAPVGAYGPVEDVHMILEHAITTCLMEG